MLAIVPICSFQVPYNRVGKVWNCTHLKFKSEWVSTLERRLPLFCISISYVYTNKKNQGQGCGLSTIAWSFIDVWLTVCSPAELWVVPALSFKTFKLVLRDSRYQQQRWMLPVCLGLQEMYADRYEPCHANVPWGYRVVLDCFIPSYWHHNRKGMPTSKVWIMQ